MPLVLNIEKSTQSISLCLQKNGITPIPVDVAFAMDVSGSFHDEHCSGITNDLLTRMVPWGLVFDPDKKLAFYSFSDKVDNCPDVTVDNYSTFMKDHVIGHVNGYNGGTEYAPVLAKILSDTAPSKVGMFSKLFGKKSTEEKPLLVLFVTDGQTFDERETIKVLQNAQNNGRKMYVIFFGVAPHVNNFQFLSNLGTQFSNVSFVHVANINKFVAQSDEELNDTLISDELINWFN